MSDDGTRAELPTKFADDVLVGESVEAVTAHTVVPKLTRECKALSDLRHPAMKRGIEACDLGQTGIMTRDGIDDRDLTRQVQRGEGDKFVESGFELCVHKLRFGVFRAAVDDAMSFR